MRFSFRDKQIFTTIDNYTHVYLKKKKSLKSKKLIDKSVA